MRSTTSAAGLRPRLPLVSHRALPQRPVPSLRTRAVSPNTAAVQTGKVQDVADSAHFKALLAETQANNQLLVIDYLTTWCGPCKLVAPQVEELAEDFAAKGLRVGKFTCDASDDNKRWAMELNIKSLPTFRVYRGGNEAHVAQVVGTKIADLRKAVESQLAEMQA